jgi:hypothetical protein
VTPNRLGVPVAVLSVAVLSGVGLTAGCGPIEYVNQVTRKASSEVAAAKSVNAAEWAPYYFTLAVEYLEKAHEEASRADYQAANRFGRKSHNAAVKARELAIERARKGEKPGPPPDDDDDGDGDGAADVAPLIDDDGGDDPLTGDGE